MRIQLSEHFTYSKLLRFTFPSIVMMIFTSIYSVVDGLFVSNFVGKTPFAALNLVYPVIMILGTLGFMVGTGGSAIVGRLLGEQKPEKANRCFSMMVEATVVSGVILTLAAILLMRPIAIFLKAEGEMLEYCVLYARIILAANPFFILQNVFQSFFVSAERPKLGLLVMVGAGLTNIVLDALLVGVGQALATCPGISRSGTTITAGCFVGFERKFAVRYSFLMSIPAILGANILSLKDALEAGILWEEVPIYLVGVAVSAVVGYACIRLIRLVADKGKFGFFAYYCWLAGIVTLALIFTQT